MSIFPCIQLLETPSETQTKSYSKPFSAMGTGTTYVGRKAARRFGDRKQLPSVRLQRPGYSRVLISAARRIPPELWSKIFVHCLPPSSQLMRINVTSAPLLLCQVCSLWRQIAISSPQLWCRFSVKGPRTLLDARIPLMQTWLSRSGALPLSIEIACPCNRRDPPPDRFVHAILPYSRRWQHLRLDLPLSSIEALLCNPHVLIPLLETVKINLQTVLPHDHSFRLSSSARRLHTIYMCASSFSTETFTLPWAQLTCLFLSTTKAAPCLDECLEIFQRCPKLQFARIPLSDAPSASDAPRLSPIFLPSLHTLYINTCGDFSPFIDGLILPSLRDLHINKWTTSDISSCLSLVSRSACRIERLNCHEAPLSETDLLRLVQNIPSLVELVATRYDRSNCRRDNLVTARVAALLARERLIQRPMI